MKKTKVLTILILATLFCSITIDSAQADKRSPWRPRFNRTDPELIQRFEKQIENYIRFRILLSSINIILFGYLLFMYIQLYRETGSKFSLGLTALSSVLLIYSISGNPLVLQMFRGSNPIWFNVFNIIPDIFASIGAAILIYLTRT
jgi:ABC-type Fe3+-siderophore transport system permease subunit